MLVKQSAFIFCSRVELNWKKKTIKRIKFFFPQQPLSIQCRRENVVDNIFFYLTFDGHERWAILPGWIIDFSICFP